jgi:hypothetical protein
LISRRVTAAELEWLERRCGGLGRVCENADAGDFGRPLRHDFIPIASSAIATKIDRPAWFIFHILFLPGLSRYKSKD